MALHAAALSFSTGGAALAHYLEEIRQFLNEHNLHFGMKLEDGDDGELYLLGQGGSASGSSMSSTSMGSSTTLGTDLGTQREAETEL